MPGPRSWDRQYQDVWEERAAERSLPNWVRIAFLALGTHRANGHAPFAPGHIGLVLGTVDRTTGEVKEVDKANVQRAIRAAVKSGYLAEGSSSTCLIVPGHAVTGGLGGEPGDRCDRHGRKDSRRGHLRDVSQAAS